MSKVASGATADVSDLVLPIGVLGADGKWYALVGGATDGKLSITGLPAVGQAAAAASLPVVLASDQSVALSGALTNRSGTITAGATAQSAAAALATRKYLFLLNPATEIEILWFSTVATAVAASPSIPLYPGQSFEMNGTFCSSGALSVIAATTGHVWIAREGG